MTTPRRLPLSLLFIAVVVGGIGWALPSAGVLSVLIPAMVSETSPDSKVIVLGAIVSISAVAAITSGVFAGALSDILRQTRGTRAPVMLAGSLIASCALVWLASASSAAEILAAAVVVEIGVNAAVIPLRATIAERFPPEFRATAFGVYGIAVLVGFTAGVSLSSLFVSDPTAGVLVLAPITTVSMAVCLGLLAITRNEDRSAWPQTRVTLPPLPRPTTSRPFYLALGAQLAVAVAVNSVTTYQLYILTDYVGLSTSEASRMLVVVALTNLATSLVGGLVVGRMSDNAGRRTPFLLVAVGLILGGLVALILSPSVLGVLVFAAAGGLGGGGYFAAAPALVTETIRDPRSYGRDLGIANGAPAGGRAIASVFGSLVVSLVAFGGLFVAAASLLVVGAGLYARIGAGQSMDRKLG